MFSVDAVEIAGVISKFKYTAANGNQVTKAFCPDCSSPVYGVNSGNPEHMTIAVGCMDDLSAFTPEVVIFADNKPHWDWIDPDLPTFAKQPDWKPEDDA